MKHVVLIAYVVEGSAPDPLCDAAAKLVAEVERVPNAGCVSVLPVNRVNAGMHHDLLKLGLNSTANYLRRGR